MVRTTEEALGPQEAILQNLRTITLSKGTQEALPMSNDEEIWKLLMWSTMII